MFQKHLSSNTRRRLRGWADLLCARMDIASPEPGNFNGGQAKRLFRGCRASMLAIVSASFAWGLGQACLVKKEAK